MKFQVSKAYQMLDFKAFSKINMENTFNTKFHKTFAKYKKYENTKNCFIKKSKKKVGKLRLLQPGIG